MFHMKYIIYSIVLHLIESIPQLNLYYTNRISENEKNVNHMQHDCLSVIDPDYDNVYEIWFYCMGELSLKFSIENNNNNNNTFPRFTFYELMKQNITSEQLLIWSAPMDLIERYQFYLDQLSKSINDRIMENEIFYKCPLGRFGLICEYELEYFHSDFSSLYQMIVNYYKSYKYNPNELTCYTHLKCNRGHYPSCLDWTEICDGEIDCLDNGLDEKDCWQLEINQCNENEYRCGNGECIHQSFYGENEQDTYDCQDASDEIILNSFSGSPCEFMKMLFKCEDIKCQRQGSTSSCAMKRQDLLTDAMFSIKDKFASDQCWSAFKCLMHISNENDEKCIDICNDNECIKIIENECPSTMFIPTIPFLFSNIYLFYQKNSTQMFEYGQLQYLYMCHNNSYYDDYFGKNPKIIINNMKCYYRPYKPIFSIRNVHSNQATMFNIRNDLWKYYHVLDYNLTYCNLSYMYQCMNSKKCISKSRLNDRIDDCPKGDDEDHNITYGDFEYYQYYERTISEYEYKMKMLKYIRNNIYFQTICNGYTEMIPININGKNETDETECDQWECNNIYTHCNERWNCYNGEDELDCDLTPIMNCPSNSHLCVSSNTYQLICLPIEKANNNHIDCLGGTDEPKLCRKDYEIQYPDSFYCTKNNFSICINSEQLCNGKIDCDNGDDENFCENEPIEEEEAWESDYCYLWHPPNGLTDIEKTICKTLKGRILEHFNFFSIPKFKIPSMNIKNHEKLSLSRIEHQYRCHYGLNIRIWLNETSYFPSCLCPPNFYGNHCQYQNERIILSLKFRASSNSWETLFAIIILLIDNSNQQIIHSYQQLSYLTSRDCQRKFQFYLYYSTQPKNISEIYSIRIDIYEKISFKYRASLLYPIKFQFLPVHHISIIVDIPQENKNMKKCLFNPCVHGQCMIYSNNENYTYCHCNQGWIGKYCSIQIDCQCSLNSLCIGRSANNRSICICSINKFGDRCLLDTLCDIKNNSICENNGQCIPDDYFINSKQSFHCLCRKGFTGKRCEFIERKFLLTFDRNLILSDIIFIHFIRINQENFPIRSTTFLTNLNGNYSFIIYWSKIFHIAFIELSINNYYLIVIQRKSFEHTSIIKKTIKLSDKCLHVNQIFNKTFFQWHFIRQIKYYHLACQISSLNLSCFYDDIQFCLCYYYQGKHLANCFQFNHNQTMNCLGTSECQNQGQCFQDDPYCPRRSACLCQPCYYGRLCQFYTTGFGLSLDGILSYHIRSYKNLTHQSNNVKITMGLTMSFFLVGIINSFLSVITFKNKIIQEVGCGLYLFGSSITTLIITIIFTCKYWILILSQMGILTNRLFLSIQCYSLDFILRTSLNMDQWFNACIAVERAYTAIKDTRFSKKRSKQIAKFVIWIIFIINLASSIHDPLHRKLIEEDNDDDNNHKRIWCIVTYSNQLQIYNSIIYIFHFVGPFLINLISSIVLIIKKIRQKSRIQNHLSLKILLKEQIIEHKHILFAPIILIILGIPRLILSLISKCMQSTNDSWLFLIGYFISFIPPMFTAILFIYPSTFYKKELRKILHRYKINIQTRLCHVF